MFLSWVASFLLLLLMAKAIQMKYQKHEIEDDDDDFETLYHEGMSEYEMAVAFISSGKCRLSDAAKLALYGLYKQSTVGDVNKPCPSSIDFVGSAKWKSWDSYKGLSIEEAQSKYVDYVTKLVPLWKEADKLEKCETTEGNIEASSGGFGLKVSTVSLGDENDWKEGDDVFFYMGNKNEEKVLSYINAYPDKINDVDDNGRTLLHWACDRGCESIVSKLIEAGATLNIKDNDSMTPLDNAFVCEQESIASRLIDAGAKVSDCNEDIYDFIPSKYTQDMN